jgi:hypothetical protein
MSMTLTDPGSDLVMRMSQSSPQEAVQIALAFAEAERAKAAQAQAEYRALAEVEFNQHGQVVKANLAGLYRLAAAYAKSKIVPEHYQSKWKPDGKLLNDATSDCFIAIQMAVRLGIDPLAYMQASYIVHGRPGIESKLATALLNTSGKIKGRLRYKFSGKPGASDRSCTCYAIDADSGEEVSATVTWAMAEAEGWTAKNGSKWKTMADVMFQYRSAMFLIRLYYSEVLMGVNTVDELEDIGPGRTESGGTRTLSDMTARLGAPEAAPIDADADTDPGDQTDGTLGDGGDVEVIDLAMLAKFDGCKTSEEIAAAFEKAMPAVSDLQALVAARDAVLAKLPKVEKAEGKKQKTLA